MTPRLALVPGEPAGVGPELCVRLAQRSMPCRLVAIADPDTLIAAARTLQLPLVLRDVDVDAEDYRPGELALLPIRQTNPVLFGKPDPANAKSVISALLRAGQGCLSGEFDGMVTGPIHKASINAGGIAYVGTTELLAEQSNTRVVMMLANRELRVALATTHLPLRAVPDAISRELLARVLQILHTALQRDFGISRPRIAVLGLNPHAGENGVLGHEEIEIIIPTLEAFRNQGMTLLGPLSADTAFLPQNLPRFDAILAMYHDQGLPVLKHNGFEQAVNITLGLPYPRVAVDHGTALDLAGKNSADPSSLFAAVEQCTLLAQSRTST